MYVHMDIEYRIRKTRTTNPLKNDDVQTRENSHPSTLLDMSLLYYESVPCI